jgi:hypothetical protein
MQVSISDYTKPCLATNKVVESFNGYVSYLLIMDEVSHHVCWAFPQKSKEPPIDIVSHFLHMYGHLSGGVIHCNQVGELAWLSAFRSIMMEKHLYVIEPTGADSPSQKGGLKYGMTPLPSRNRRSYMAWLYRPNTGRPPLRIRRIFTTVGFTDSSNAPRLRNGRVAPLT